MGIIRRLFGGDERPAPITPAAPRDTGPSPSEIAEQEEEERRRRILAINQRGQQGQLTGPGGAPATANIGRKQLLGL